MNPCDKFRVVPSGEAEEQGVYCKECGALVVGIAQFAAVRLDDQGALKALPFPCLRHRCPAPTS
jgi:hypothetical protein